MSHKRKSHLRFSLKGNLKGSLVFPQMPFNSNVLCLKDCYPLGQLSVSVCADQLSKESLFCVLTLGSLVGCHRGKHTDVCPQHVRPKLAALCSQLDH